MNDSMYDLVEEFDNENRTFSTEGSTGVKNLCRLLNAIGYEDKTHFGQFHQKGNYGDLIDFLEDNPGAVEAVKEWICDQNIDEWKENILSSLPEKEYEGDGECPECGADIPAKDIHLPCWDCGATPPKS